MSVQLLYFAWVRERIGIDGEVADPPADVDTVARLIDWLERRGPPYAAAFADRSRLRFAIDQRIADADARIAHAREIAVFPPVTGG